MYAQTSIDGVWNTGKDNTKVKITKENNIWMGKILSSDNEKAPLGKEILKDLEKKGETWNGKLFVIRKKEWYNVRIQINGNELELIVKAGFINKSSIWEREE